MAEMSMLFLPDWPVQHPLRGGAGDAAGADHEDLLE